MAGAKRITATVILAALLYVGWRGVGALPPLGPLVHPTVGIWAVAAQRDFPRTLDVSIPGMRDSVRVVFDDRAVPHIFAHDLEDAYRALGYVVARSRLFQLELQWRVPAGRLSELLGKDVLKFDESQRALGLAWSAKRAWATRDTSSEVIRAMEAYAEGVNARIDELTPKDIPLEYRLIGKRPSPWKAVYSLYLIRQMGYTLTYDRGDLTAAHLAAMFGDSVAGALRPLDSPIQEPIVPPPFSEPRYAFEKLPVPAHQMSGTKETHADGRAHAPAGPSLADATPGRSPPPVESSCPPVVSAFCTRGEGLGSNNWVVSPGRSATRHALLAGDPHLVPTLPSIWYEAHVVVPSAGLDVYGATIPGSPAIIIGFNRDVAWSFTNSEADVVDYYHEVLDDSVRPAHYLVDGAWKPLQRRIEQYRGRHGELLAVDTLYATDRGPLVGHLDAPLSMRWTVLDDTTAAAAFFTIAEARDVHQWMTAFAPLVAPPQNGAVADRNGDIAIRTTGEFPVRPKGASGVPVRDGTASANDWTGALPVSSYPFAENPKQGYLASANQEPWDPKFNSAYLGANWEPPWRAMRINELLRADSNVTVDDMREFQTDPGSVAADYFAPFFIRAVSHVAHEGGEALQGMSLDSLRTAGQLLDQWDRRYTKTSQRAILFELAMQELQRRAWDELRVPSPRGTDARLAYLPNNTVLAELIADSTSWWWDDHHTDRHETRDVILAQSLLAAYDTALARYGAPEAGGWRWSDVHPMNIYHLLHLKPFSVLHIPVQGGRFTLNPVAHDGGVGSSWRMVVELGPDVKAWTIYPGGQSGNPLSKYYANRIPKWSDGELDPVFFPASPSDLPKDHTLATFTLSGGK